MENGYRIVMMDGWSVPHGYEVTIGGEIDVAEVAGLIVAAETAIDGSSPVNESFVGMILNAPGTTQDEDVLTIRESVTGKLVGFGLHRDPDPHVESVTSGWVHPEHVGSGLGSTIVGWGLKRARSKVVLAPKGTRVTNRCQAGDADTAAAALFSDFGYAPDRHEIEMELVLDGPVRVSELPQGVALQTISGVDDIPVLARTITDAFRDHYGWVDSSWDETLERYATYRAMDEWDDDLVYIAQTRDGPAGALIALRSFGSHDDVGYIGALGVLQQWRGMGLARALLTTAFANYARRGMRAVRLDVDADSLTGATRLYRGVGMEQVRSETAYLIELRAGIDLVKREEEVHS